MRDLFSKLNISKALVRKGVSLVVVFAMLITAYVAFSMNKTLGWFAKNNTVTASGMVTQAYQDKFRVEYSFVSGQDVNWHVLDGNTIDLSELRVPGDTVVIQFRVTSIGSKPVYLTGFGVDAPGMNDDIPKIDANGKACYLSTELQTRLVEMAKQPVSEDAEADDNQYTIPVDDENDEIPYTALRDETNGAPAIDYFDWVNWGSTDSSILLNPQDSVVFTVEFEFINRTDPQDIFKNFTSTGGACNRYIFLTFD